MPDPVRLRGRYVMFGEYRYWCPHCTLEWLYYSKDRSSEEVPGFSQLVWDPASHLLIERVINDDDVERLIREDAEESPKRLEALGWGRVATRSATQRCRADASQ